MLVVVTCGLPDCLHEAQHDLLVPDQMWKEKQGARPQAAVVPYCYCNCTSRHLVEREAVHQRTSPSSDQPSTAANARVSDLLGPAALLGCSALRLHYFGHRPVRGRANR
jgi:hypothetical protein